MKTPADMDNTRFYRSLTRNLILIMILVSFTPLILIAGIIGYRFETSYRTEALAHLRELVLKHQQNVNAFLNEKLSTIRTLAESSSCSQLGDSGFLARHLEILQRTGGGFVDLGLVRSDGNQISYAGPLPLADANYAEATWFPQAMARPLYISDVFLGLRGSPHFIVAVRKACGETSYILRATVDFDAFNRVVSNIGMGETGVAFILNTSGEFQTKPPPTVSINKPFILSKVPGVIETGADPERGDRPQLNGWKLRLRDDWGKILIAEGPNSRGDPSLYILTPIKSGEWVLVYQQEMADAFADLYGTRRLALAIFLLGGIAIVIKAFVLARRMVARIAQIDREKQLMTERMIEAGKLASLGELAAGIAHEINNPVAVMVEEAGWIEDLLHEEDLRETKNVEEIRVTAGRIKAQGKRCREITQKLLSFARRTDPRPRPVQPNAVIEDVLGLTVQRASQSNIKIVLSLAVDLPEVLLSPSELQQVLLNLVNNAIDAIDETRGGTIEISTRTENGFIVIDIKDDGEGIPKESLQRIFDPFYTTKPVGKGTGLGLSICYGIIRKWKGSITVESEVAVGTTFHILIPVWSEALVEEPEKNTL